MSQIKVKILKQGTPSDKVLSCAYFIMPSSAYKDTSKYIDGLDNIIQQSRKLTGFETRIYVDNTTSEQTLELVKDYKNVSVYHYDCELFREGDGHVGTFGTLVRFLPMFEEGLKTVWVTDIDLARETKSNDWFTNKFVKLVSNYDVFGENFTCYNRKPWTVGQKYTFVAFRMVFNVTFPRRILTHYINQLANGYYNDIIEIVNDYNVRKPRNERFPYGMDEFFVNGILYKYIKQHDMTCLFRKTHDIGHYFIWDSSTTQKEKHVLMKYDKTPTKELLQQVKPIYRKMIPIFIQKDQKYACMKETLESLDLFKDEMVDWIEVSGKDI